MNSTNGNGTSIKSNTVLTNTQYDSTIVINIYPITTDYIYNYNYNRPIELTITVSSLHSITPIILTITNMTNQNVAEISKVEGSDNTYKLVLRNAGTLNLYATQKRAATETVLYGNSETKSPPLITLSKDVPQFNPLWSMFRDSYLFIGKT